MFPRDWTDQAAPDPFLVWASGRAIARAADLLKLAKTVGPNAFQSCLNLSNATLANGLTTVADYAFANCPNLTSVSLPESLTTLGTAAFVSCGRLPAIVIPRGCHHFRQRILFLHQSRERDDFQRDTNHRAIRFLGLPAHQPQSAGYGGANWQVRV